MEDRFNEGTPCITHFVFLHVIVRISQMLLKISRHQMMFKVSYVILCAEVTCKGDVVKSNKVKSKIKHEISDHFQHCFRFMFHSQVSNHNFYSLFLNLSTLLCCIDFEICLRCMFIPKHVFYGFSEKGNSIRLFYK